MRILISAFVCDPLHGTEPNLGFSLGRYLAELGHEVHTLTTPKGKAHIEQVMAKSPVPGLHFHYIAMPAWAERIYKMPAGMTLYYYMWQERAAALAKTLHAQHPLDLVHHITWGSLKLGSALYKTGLPVFMGPIGGGQMADPAYKHYFGPGWNKEVLRGISTGLMLKANPHARETVRRARKIFAANRDTETLLLKHGANPHALRLIPDVALPEGFGPAKVPQRQAGPVLKLLWIGRILPIKGLELVLEALSEVDPAVNWQLTIVGDGSLAASIPGWVAKFNLGSRVNWVGRVPWDEVKAFYANHDAFLLTSLRESCGSQFVEAMAFGLPIITWAYHGVPTFVPGGAGILVPHGAPAQVRKSLAEAIAKMAAMPTTERQQMAQTGFDAAQQYYWPNKIKWFVAEYEQLFQKQEA